LMLALISDIAQMKSRYITSVQKCGGSVDNVLKSIAKLDILMNKYSKFFLNKLIFFSLQNK